MNGCNLTRNMKDTEAEKLRYDKRALKQGDTPYKEKIADWHLTPIQKYNELITENLESKHKVLEIGAGTGNNTRILLETGAQVLATDVSLESLKYINRTLGEFKNLKTKLMDMQELEFKSNSFDFVVSAGSLSYGDNDLVMNEIYRVLKKDGKFICVDSLNHNPIYRINRRIRVFMRQRSKLTVKNMPTLQLIQNYEAKFGRTKAYYYGSFLWLMPILSLVIGKERAAYFSNLVDKVIKAKKSAFKFVLVVHKIK